MKSRFRNRLYPTLPPSPLDPWINFGLSLLASLGAAAAALAFDLQHGVPFFSAWGLSFSLVYLAHLGRRFLVLHGTVEKDRMQACVLLMLPAVGLALSLPEPTGAAMALITTLAVHGYLLRFARPGGAAVLATLMPVIEVLFAMDAIWNRGWGARLFGALWMILALLGAAILITWLHARSTRRSLPRRHFSNQQPAEDEAGLWQRTILVLQISLVLLPLGLIFQQSALLATPSGVAYAGFGDPKDAVALPDQESAQPSTTSSEGLMEEDPEDSEPAPPTDKRLVFPEEVDWAGSLPRPGAGKDSILAEIRCSTDTTDEEGYVPTYGPGQPLYLVASTLDTLSADGLRRKLQGESVYHANSGLGPRDWTVFDAEVPLHKTTEYSIRLRNLPFSSGKRVGRESILLHDRRMIALKHPKVRLADDGTALTEADDAILTYHWLQTPIPQDRPLLPGPLAKQGLVQFPDDDPRFEVWAEEARLLCADLTNPEDKLERIVGHFRSRFYYDPEPSPANGMEALADFFANRSGYCTYFASGAVLFLRANGIPCRIATGFLVTEFDPQRGTYLARLSDAHAWVEVQQADGSWRTIEPTPPQRRRAALDAMLAGLDYEVLPPVEAAPEAVEVEETAPEAEGEVPPEFSSDKPWERLASTLGFVLTVVPIALAVLALGRIMWMARSGSQRREKVTPLPEEAAHSLAYWIRVEELLAHLGFHRRRSQTGAEFAHHVQRWGGEDFQQFPQVARLVYRTRFGGHAWLAAEEIFLRRFEEGLEQRVRER